MLCQKYIYRFFGTAPLIQTGPRPQTIIQPTKIYMDFKHAIAILCLSICGLALHAQNTSVPSVSYIINGLFFREIPEDLNDPSQFQDLTGFMVTSDNNITVNGIYAPSHIFSDAELEMSIPANDFPNGEILLKLYEEIIAELKTEEGNDIDEEIETGQQLPEFEAYDRNRQKWADNNLQGSLSLLVIMDPDHIPSAGTIGLIGELQNQIADLKVITVTDDSHKEAASVIDRLPSLWTNLIGDGSFLKYMKNRQYPMMIVTDTDNTIAKVCFGESPENIKNLKKAILNLL